MSSTGMGLESERSFSTPNAKEPECTAVRDPPALDRYRASIIRLVCMRTAYLRAERRQPRSNRMERAVSLSEPVQRRFSAVSCWRVGGIVTFLHVCLTCWHRFQFKWSQCIIQNPYVLGLASRGERNAIFLILCKLYQPNNTFFAKFEHGTSPSSKTTGTAITLCYNLHFRIHWILPYVLYSQTNQQRKSSPIYANNKIQPKK